MKKILSYLILMLAVCALTFTACGDDDDNKDEPEPVVYDDGTACEAGKSIYCVNGVYSQPKIVIAEGVEKTTLTVEVTDAEGTPVTYKFKDSDGDGELDKYEDWRLGVSDRADDLISQLSNDQKGAFLYETFWMNKNVGYPTANGEVSETVKGYIDNWQLRFSLAGESTDYTHNLQAKYHNNIQKLCEAADFGVPMMLCVDPATGWGINQDVSGYEAKNNHKVVGRWCYNLGLGAINDPDYVKEVAGIHAQAYKAHGVNMLLGPMCDVIGEPRWARVYDTMGSDPEIVGNNVKAYIQGLQGSDDGTGVITVAATIKHFPGGGANEDGMDSHTWPGRYAANAGNNFEAHVGAFATALEANPACLMPCYSIFHNAVYKETVVEELKTSHHVEEIMIDILREDLGWDGMVTSDWGAVTGNYAGAAYFTVGGSCYGFPTDVTTNDVVKSYADCGGHQIGMGGYDEWLKALADGFITQEQYDNAAKKCVEVTFKVGAFENPYVDEDNVDAFFQGLEDKIAEVTRKAMVLVKNEDSTLPVASGKKVYFDGVDDSVLSYFTDVTVTSSLEDADIAIIRIAARKGEYFGMQSQYTIQEGDPERYGAAGSGFLGGGVPIGFLDVIKTYYPDADPGSEDNTRGEPYLDNNSNMAASNGNHNPYQVRHQAWDGIKKLQRAIAARDTGGAAESTPVLGTNETYWDTDATNPIDCDTNGDGDYEDAGFAANSNLKIVACVFGVRPFEYRTEFDSIDAMVVEFGINDENLLSALLGEDDFSFTSKLPYGLPANNTVVEEAKEDLFEDEASILVVRGTGIQGW